MCAADKIPFEIGRGKTSAVDRLFSYAGDSSTLLLNGIGRPALRLSRGLWEHEGCLDNIALQFDKPKYVLLASGVGCDELRDNRDPEKKIAMNRDTPIFYQAEKQATRPFV